MFLRPTCACSVYGPDPACENGLHNFKSMKLSRVYGSYDTFLLCYDAYLLHLGRIAMEEFNARHAVEFDRLTPQDVAV